MIYPDFNALLEYRFAAKKLNYKQHQKVSAVGSGQYRSAIRGQGLEFEEVREYVPGDDIRNIDWRVTARTDKPYLKLFREEKERNILICLDMNPYMRFGTKNTFKSVQAANVAAMLAWSGHHNHDRVGGLLFGGVKPSFMHFAPKHQQRSLSMMLRAISDTENYQMQNTVPLSKVITKLRSVAGHGTLVFLIADFFHLDEEAERALVALKKKCDLVLVPISDPADAMLAPVGQLRCANDNKTMVINSNDQKIRDHYHTEWKNYERRLQELTHTQHLACYPISTKDDVVVKMQQMLGGWRK